MRLSGLSEGFSERYKVRFTHARGQQPAWHTCAVTGGSVDRDNQYVSPTVRASAAHLMRLIRTAGERRTYHPLGHQALRERESPRTRSSRTKQHSASGGGVLASL